MTDLSKIDFGKCELPRGMSAEFSAKTDLSAEAVFIRDKRLSIIAVKATGDGWRVRLASQMLIDDMFELQGTTKAVDAFIEAELQRTTEELLPQWRECSREEAMANTEASEFIWVSDTDVLKTSWAPMSCRKGEFTGGFYGYRTRAPKAEPKMPSVKAPEGLVWALLGSMALPDEKPNWWLVPKWATDRDLEHVDTFEVPRTTLQRDAILACVAAFDEANGKPGRVMMNGSPWRLVEIVK